jgi:hypothetical protein
MTLYGKGYFLWKIPQVMKGDPAAIASKAVDAGLSHVLIKIADGADWVYNYNDDDEVDLVPPVRDALLEAGLSVWGWHYVRGDDPVGEANLAIERMKELGLEGYVIDAEGEYKKAGKKLRIASWRNYALDCPRPPSLSAPIVFHCSIPTSHLRPSSKNVITRCRRFISNKHIIPRVKFSVVSINTWL